MNTYQATKKHEIKNTTHIYNNRPKQHCNISSYGRTIVFTAHTEVSCLYLGTENSRKWELERPTSLKANPGNYL
jgi:hypothetical protein